MRRTAVLIAALSLVVCAHAQQPLTQTLFDFEDGIDAWWGNVYGGEGECVPAATDEAKFGSGALHCEVTAVEGGSNTVCPWFPLDASWREWEWGVISFWVKGDGTAYNAKLSVTVGLEDDESPMGYSFSVPLDSTEWRQVRAPVRSFWNRQGVPMDTRGIGRLMFGCSGTHSFDIDHIVLEAPQRPVALQAIGAVEGTDLLPRMVEFTDGRHGLAFDPSVLGDEGAQASGALTPDGGDGHEFLLEIPAGAPAGDVLIELPPAQASGDAKLTLDVARGGNPLSSAAYSLSLVASKAAIDPTPLQLVPAPKEYTALRSKFSLPKTVALAVAAGAVDPSPAVNLLCDEMTSWGLVDAQRMVAYKVRAPSEISMGEMPPLPPQYAKRVAELPAEGYMLEVTDAGIRIAANDTRGLVNGACTLLQAIESHFAITSELAAPGMRVFDWPNLPIRTLSMGVPTHRWGHPNDAPVDPEFFKDYLRRTVIRQKLNMIVFLVGQGVQSDTHPEVDGPAAWSKETMREIIDMCRSYGVEPVPGQNSLGHANWLCIPHNELAEDGDVHQICTTNPESKRIMLEMYQELIDLFDAKYFHVGLDEVRWNTHQLPEDQRCPLCAGKDKRDIFVEWVQMLHGFLTDQDVEMMMWGDMILPGHNGGVPFNLKDTVDRLPKDVIICNWSASFAPNSTAWLRDHGYERILKANSRGTTLQDQEWVIGNMMGMWNKTPWLHEHISSKSSYMYSSQLLAAEYSWNFWPNNFDLGVPLDNAFFEARPLMNWRLGAHPVAADGPPQQVALPAGAPVEGVPAAEVSFGALSFAVDPAQALAPAAGGEASVEVGRTAHALYLLHTARLLDREALNEAFKSKLNWRGVPIGEYVVTYASGETATVPIDYAYEVRDPEDGRCRLPIALGALGVYPQTCSSEGLHLYAMQWVNPRPDEAIASVTLRALDAPAKPILAGLAAH